MHPISTRARAAIFLLFGFMALVGAFAQTVAVAPGTPDLHAPILITACGQSPGGIYIKVVCRKLALDSDYEEMATVATLGTKAYKTLVVVTGTSLKGMGSAGVDLDEEIRRCEALIKKAKSLGIKVIVAQIEGASRRIDDSDEKSIRSMTPLADVLITHKDANKDGYFTRTAADKKIPQMFVAQQLDLLKLFPLIFKN
jgi:hypothetical protein